MINILGPAFLLSLVLLGIHSFFGLKIIQRGIIFTDLAIGQMSALGAAVSLFLLDGRLAYVFAGGFALAAGLLITAGCGRSRHQEAFIGLLYALGLSGVFLLLSRSPHGMEKFNELMAADILFTPTSQIIRVAGWYALIGIILAWSQKKLAGHWRELCFFGLFALTVTSSVAMAGVMVVFAILVGPASIAVNLEVRHPLAWAWLLGTLTNLGAVILSYQLDFPTGYTLVFCHATAAIFVFLLRRRGGQTKTE